MFYHYQQPNSENVKSRPLRHGLFLLLIGLLSIPISGQISQASSKRPELYRPEPSLFTPTVKAQPPNMPCAEFTNAIAWNKQSTSKERFPVKAYFTKHFGGGATSLTALKDTVHYASGDVFAVDAPTSYLKGTLKVSKNTEQDGEMVETSDLTYDVEIFPDGTLSYLMKLKGKPVGGLPATQVKGTCVNNVLLTATSGLEVATVGVARKPSSVIPW
jgi:hypothetical protein